MIQTMLYKSVLGALTAAMAFAPLQIPAFAQAEQMQTEDSGPIVLDPLFEYPMAPEEIEGIEGKSDWLVENFWNPMDLKSKNAVDQTKLNHAFGVYVTPMRWAQKEKSLASIDALLLKLQKNPTLLYQFVKAAEENIYGPRAPFYIDEVYVRFLDALLKNKKVKPIMKTRYQHQFDVLSATMPGSRAPRFEFEKPDGLDGEYFPMSTFTIIEFGDPSCSDCRMSRLKMESNAALTQAVAKGKVNILFIIPDNTGEWKDDVANYPETWVVGAAGDVDDIYDIRLTPTFYTIGADGNIISKNITVDEAVRQALENIKQ